MTTTGGTPSDVSGQTVSSIAHAFASLSAAITGAVGAGYLNTADLVTGNYVMNIPCYYDTGADTTAVIISGYTTGANNYINIYTPNNTDTQIIQSQRHSGKWDTGKYRLEVAGQTVLAVSGDFVRIDGLQIQLTDTGATYLHGIHVESNSGAESRISNNIIRGVLSGTADADSGILLEWYATGTRYAKIWNNIIYDFKNGSYVSNYGFGIRASWLGYIYNNTIYNNYMGVWSDSNYIIVKNNISYGNNDNNVVDSATWDSSSTNNLSGPGSDPDIPGLNPQNGVTVAFADPNGSPRDLRLASNDTGAMEKGADLSTDAYLPFSTDIEGESRPFAASWDIGADEYRSPTAVFLKSFSAIEYEGKILLQWKTGYEANNLGFHVYRDEDGQLIQINPELITGAAFLAGAGRATAGHAYAWWDTSVTSPGRGDPAGRPYYWLEDVDLSGKRTMNGPVIPDISPDPIPERAQAVLLSQLSRGQSEKDKIASRLWALQARLGKNQTSDVSN